MSEPVVPGPGPSYSDDEPVPDTVVEQPIDADANGHLATGLFVGVIAVMLVVIYAFAMAA